VVSSTFTLKQTFPISVTCTPLGRMLHSGGKVLTCTVTITTAPVGFSLLVTPGKTGTGGGALNNAG